VASPVNQYAADCGISFRGCQKGIAFAGIAGNREVFQVITSTKNPTHSHSLSIPHPVISTETPLIMNYHIIILPHCHIDLAAFLAHQQKYVFKHKYWSI
jgi:hypothetical protein